MIELTPELIRKHKKLIEAQVTVKGHTRHSKKGKAFNVKAHERELTARQKMQAAKKEFGALAVRGIDFGSMTMPMFNRWMDDMRDGQSYLGKRGMRDRAKSSERELHRDPNDMNYTRITKPYKFKPEDMSTGEPRVRFHTSKFKVGNPKK